MSKKQINYLKVFELKFTDKKKLTEKQLFKKIMKHFISKKIVSTKNGTFYIKNYAKKSNSLIFLFGKDNDDASNYKRDKKNLNITKLKINEKTEILTDFIHIGISKTERLGSYVLLLEKSQLINHYNIKNFIDSLILDPSLVILSRRVTKDFYDEVKDSKRILKIREIVKDPELPLPILEEEMQNIEVSDTFEIKAQSRKSISLRIFESFFNKTNLKSNHTKLVVDIINQYDNKMVLAFDLTESQYSIKLNTYYNLKTEIIQENISNDIERYISLDNKGELY